MTIITLKYGTLDTNNYLDGWIITSKTVIAEGAEDLPLQSGDRINLNGDVFRKNEFIGNIS